MTTLDHMQMRLFAAGLVFYAAALAFGADPWLHYMGMCFFFVLLAIPIRLIFAAVEFAGWLADSLTGRKSLGTRP